MHVMITRNVFTHRIMVKQVIIIIIIQSRITQVTKLILKEVKDGECIKMFWYRLFNIHFVKNMVQKWIPDLFLKEVDLAADDQEGINTLRLIKKNDEFTLSLLNIKYIIIAMMYLMAGFNLILLDGVRNHCKLYLTIAIIGFNCKG